MEGTGPTTASLGDAAAGQLSLHERLECLFLPLALLGAIATIPLTLLEQNRPTDRILAAADWAIWGLFATRSLVLREASSSKAGRLFAVPKPRFARPTALPADTTPPAWGPSVESGLGKRSRPVRPGQGA